MELTILNLVLLTFVAGVVGGIVVADSMDTYENRRRRHERRARREKNRKNVNFTIDKF